MSKSPQLVFLLGSGPRSGTNYLFRLLLKHPEVKPMKLGGEDFLLYFSNHLMDFTQKVSDIWNPSWGNDRESLNKALGSGLEQMLGLSSDTKEKVVLAKTPLAGNSENVFELFPNAKVILLVRHGKDMIESYIKSFNSSFDVALWRYASEANSIIKFRKKFKDFEDEKFIVLRYEDIVQNIESEIERLLSFLGLPADSYDMQEALNQGVIGSSKLKDEDGAVTWKKEFEKSDSFKAIGAGNDWSKAQKWRYHWVLNGIDKHFKYETNNYSGVIYKLYNYAYSFSRRLQK